MCGERSERAALFVFHISFAFEKGTLVDKMDGLNRT